MLTNNDAPKPGEVWEFQPNFSNSFRWTRYTIGEDGAYPKCARRRVDPPATIVTDETIDRAVQVLLETRLVRDLNTYIGASCTDNTLQSIAELVHTNLLVLHQEGLLDFERIKVTVMQPMNQDAISIVLERK